MNVTTRSMARSPNLNHKVHSPFFKVHLRFPSPYFTFKIQMYEPSADFCSWLGLKGKSRRTFDTVESTKSVFIFYFFFNFDLPGGGQAARRSPHFGSTPGYMHTPERIKSELNGALQEYKRAKKRILQKGVVTMRTEFVLLEIGS